MTVVTSQPTHKVKLLGSISAPADSLWTRTVCGRMLDEDSRGYMSTFKLSGKGGIKNWRVSTNISFHFEKHPRSELGNTAIDVGL